MGRWDAMADRVRVSGTKRDTRVRDVALTRAPAVPRIHYRTFGVNELYVTSEPFSGTIPKDRA
jgi:hypothetical protein